MSFLRSLTVFIISFVFTTFIFIAITSQTMGNLIQKDSVKGFLNIEGTKLIDQQCEEQCSQFTENSTECLQECETYLANQTGVLVDKATDEIYQRNFFGINLNEVSSTASEYLIYLIIGIISGLSLFIASKTPFSTLGKNMISISVSLFVLVLFMRMIVVIVNVPMDIGKDFIDYLSPGLDQQVKYGIILLIIGIVLLVVNYIIKKKTLKKK